MSAPSSLSFGLNLAKKKQPTLGKPLLKKPAFGYDDDDNDESGKGREEDKVEEIAKIDGFDAPRSAASEVLKSKRNGTNEPPRGKPKSAQGVSVYGDLSSRTSSLKYAKEAETLDASIYDYDRAYDSMKSIDRSKKIKEEEEIAERKPKYMESLLAAAEIRKRDQLRAKEKMLQKEREAEGEEYADKEKFVTGAYKEQQIEMARLEEEEKRREEEELKKKSGMGMTGFYKSVLDRDEKKHHEIVAATTRANSSPDVVMAADDDDGAKQKSTEELARELNAKNAGAIIVNDDGQVVDKRQLLSAGLNVAPRPKLTTKSVVRLDSPRGPGGLPERTGRIGSKQAMRERQSRMLEEQLEQAAKRAADEGADKERELARLAKSRKTEAEVSSARDRYLQRKREAEAAKAKGDS